jgi:predicted esterase
MSALDLFHYKAINNGPKNIFLLHGTGGTEEDLFPLVEPFHTTHSIVGLLGNVKEGSMSRFFERNAEGIFDQESIKNESKKLADFIKEWIKINKITADDITFIGYSNGANMILATMFYNPELIKNAALLHSMLPFQPANNLDLSDHKILLSWSPMDPIIQPQASEELISLLKNSNAELKIIETDAGHALTALEVKELHSFLH